MRSVTELGSAAEPDSSTTPQHRRAVPAVLRAESFVRTMSLESWRGLFESVGEPATEPEYATVFKRLAAPVSEELVDALEFIHSHQGDDELETVLALLDAARIDAQVLVQQGAASDVLATLWIRSRGDARLHRLVTAAQLEVEARTGTRASQRFVGDSEVPVRWRAETQARLENLLRSEFGARGLGRHAQVTVEQRSGSVSIYVLRGSRLRRVVKLDDASGASDALTFRPAQCDLARLDLQTVRLEVLPSEQRLGRKYAQLIGLALGHGADFFAVEQAFELGALLSRELSVPSRPDVKIALASVTWEPESGTRMSASGRNCAAVLRRELQHPGRQTVVAARLKLHLLRGRRRVLAATIHPPHSLRCGRESDRELVMRLLEDAGLLGRAHAPALWEFVGRPRSAARWRRALGPAFDGAVASGLLVKTLLDHAADEQLSAADGALGTLEDVDDIGFGVDEGVEPRRVDPEQFEAYELALERLADTLRAMLRLTATTPPPLPAGLLELGRRDVGASAVRVFLLSAPAADLRQLATAMHGRTQADRPVLLVPPEFRDGCDVLTFVLTRWWPPFEGLPERFWDRLGWSNQVDPRELGISSRLLILPDAVELDGKPLALTDQLRRFVELVAMHPAALSPADLGERLRQGGDRKKLPDEIARKAKQKVATEIARVLPLAPASPETTADEILTSERGRGYRFLVPVRFWPPRAP